MKLPKGYNRKEREVAVDILTELMFCENMEDVHNLYDKKFKQYMLETDPFTHCPCTLEEKIGLDTEYKRQLFIEKFGYDE